MTTTPTDRSEILVERLFGATIYARANGSSSRRSPACSRSRTPRRAPTSRRYRLPADHARVLGERRGPGARRALRAHDRRHRRRARPGRRRLPHRRRRARTPTTAPAFRHGQGAHQPAGLHARPADRVDATRCPTSAPACRARRPRSPTSAAARASRRSRWRARSRGAQVDGFDADAALDPRRPPPRRRGRRRRPRFVAADADGGRASRGPYDLVLVLETLHDLARPVEALAAAREALAAGGAVLVVDERVADVVHRAGRRARADDVRLGASPTACPRSSSRSPRRPPAR